MSDNARTVIDQALSQYTSQRMDELIQDQNKYGELLRNAESQAEKEYYLKKVNRTLTRMIIIKYFICDAIHQIIDNEEEEE
jgi:hypothetical protein